MFELDNIKEGNPLRKRLEDAIDAMKEDYTSVIAEDEVGPCTPPRVLPSYHVSGPRDDFLRAT